MPGISLLGITIIPSCHNAATGSISYIILLGSYTFQWSNGATTQNISGLTPGAYWVVIKDANTGVIVNETSFLVRSSYIEGDFNIQNSDKGNNNGSAEVVVTGNVGTVSYLWNTGDTTSRIDNLPAGTYWVTITDNVHNFPSGTVPCCSITIPIKILDKSQILIDDLSCCSAKLASKYVFAKKNGLRSIAKCSMNKLFLLRGYISDICGDDGNCLTSDEVRKSTEKAKKICGCC